MLLATDHTTSIPGRFNAEEPGRPSFEILYLSGDHTIALFEIGAIVGSPFPGGTFIPNPKAHWIIINVQVQLGRVADLTQGGSRSCLRFGKRWHSSWCSVAA